METGNSAVTLAVVAILATCVGGLLWIIKYMFNKFVPMVEENNKAIMANTEATKNADKYLRERNGNDAEKHEELIKATQDIPVKMQEIADHQAKSLVASLKEVKEQHVSHQQVDKALVKKLETDKDEL